MDSGRKDLLVIAKKKQLTDAAFQREIAFLAKVLYSQQNTNNFLLATQVIDLYKYRIIQKPHLIQQALKKDSSSKPFVFICNKN